MVRREDNQNTLNVLKEVVAAELENMALFPHDGGLMSPDQQALSDRKPFLATRPSHLQNASVVEVLLARHSRCS